MSLKVQLESALMPFKLRRYVRLLLTALHYYVGMTTWR